MRKTLIAGACLLFGIVPAFAQPNWDDPKALTQLATDNNPSLARLGAELEAARQRIAPVTAQPNPMVMGGVQDKMVDFTDDEMMTMYMVGAEQTLVRPGKLAARRKAAELALTSTERQIESVRAEIERDVLGAWFDVAAVDGQAAATRQVRELVDAVIAAARVRYEVGTSAQADIIRAQLQQSDLDHQLYALRGSRNAAVARLLGTLGLPIGTEVPTLTMPTGTEDLSIPADLSVPENHPAIAALDAEIARQDALIALARQEGKPDLGLQASYGYRPDQTDMFSVVAKVEIPLNRGKTIEPRIREAIALREATRFRIEETRRALVQAMAVAAAAHEEATQQLEFHEKVLVPQAKLALESTLAAYQTGKAPFDAILGSETTYLRAQLQYYDFLIRHAKSVIEFDALKRGARAGSLGPATATTSLSGGAPSTTSAMGGM